MASPMDTCSSPELVSPRSVPDSFTCFRKLPAEIRFSIWRLAVQAYVDLPRGHCFYLTCKSHEFELKTDAHNTFLPGNPPTEESFDLDVESELCTSSNEAWSDEKEEEIFYLGLTKACRESRHVFQLETDRFDRHHEDFNSGNGIVKIKRPFSRGFTFVNVERDMVAFHLSSIEDSPGTTVYNFIRSPIWGGCTPKNVGIVYDENWLWTERHFGHQLDDPLTDWPELTIESESTLSGFAREALQLSWAGLERLWLIESGDLTPLPKITHQELVKSRHVFREQGYRCIEVRDKDVSGWKNPGRRAPLKMSKKRWKLTETSEDHVLQWRYFVEERFLAWTAVLRSHQPPSPPSQLLLPLAIAVRLSS